MMVHFRKRLDAETLKALDLRIYEKRRELEESEAAETAKAAGANDAPRESDSGGRAEGGEPCEIRVSSSLTPPACPWT